MDRKRVTFSFHSNNDGGKIMKLGGEYNLLTNFSLVYLFIYFYKYNKEIYKSKNKKLIITIFILLLILNNVY